MLHVRDKVTQTTTNTNTDTDRYKEHGHDTGIPDDRVTLFESCNMLTTTRTQHRHISKDDGYDTGMSVTLVTFLLQSCYVHRTIPPTDTT